MEPVSLRRRIFGVDPEEVHLLLTERDLEVAQLTRQTNLAERRLEEVEGRSRALERRVVEAEQRALAAEHELRRLQATLSRLSLDLARKEQEAEALRQEAEELRAQLERALGGGETGANSGAAFADPTVSFLVAEVAPILKAAEQSAASLMEQARVASEQHFAEVGKARSELQSELATISAWWNEVHQVVQPMQERLVQTRRTIEEVGDRVRDALLPLSDLLSGIADELTDLARASSPPPLLTPREIDLSPPDVTAIEEPLTVRITEETETPRRDAEPQRPTVPTATPAGTGPWWPHADPWSRETGL